MAAQIASVGSTKFPKVLDIIVGSLCFGKGAPARGEVVLVLSKAWDKRTFTAWVGGVQNTKVRLPLVRKQMHSH